MAWTLDVAIVADSMPARAACAIAQAVESLAAAKRSCQLLAAARRVQLVQAASLATPPWPFTSAR